MRHNELVAKVRAMPARDGWFLARTLALGALARRRFDRSGPRLQVAGRLRVHRRNGTIELGSRVLLWPGVKLSVRGDAQVARLSVGDGTSIGDRCELHCGERLAIGAGCLIAWDVTILDRDYHRLDSDTERTAPVAIGDRVWIGARATILPGVEIGDGAVVGAGAVVTRDVAPATLVAGNPARLVRQGVSWAP